MTIAKTIATARAFLPANPGAYARVMSAAIRSAKSDKAIVAFRRDVYVNRMGIHFEGWASDCPTARPK